MLDEHGSIERVAAVHADPALQPLADRLRETYAPTTHGQHPVARVIRGGEAEFSPHMPEDFLRATTRDPEHLRIVLELGFQSFMCVPLKARGRILGTITLVSTNPAYRYGRRDVDVAMEIARPAAVHIDNARLYAERDHIARTLQQSLLPPDLPEIPGVEMAAFYRTGREQQDIGGDFYDAFETAEGAWAVVIGDVCGKGPDAAAITGLARYTIRAVAIRERRPSAILTALNGAILRQRQDLRFCTVCYVRVHPEPTGA